MDRSVGEIGHGAPCTGLHEVVAVNAYVCPYVHHKRAFRIDTGVALGQRRSSDTGSYHAHVVELVKFVVQIYQSEVGRPPASYSLKFLLSRTALDRAQRA